MQKMNFLQNQQSIDYELISRANHWATCGKPSRKI